MSHDPPRRRHAFRTGIQLAGLALALGSCANSTSPTPEVTGGASPTPILAAIVLDRAPANLGCDAIGVEYRRVTFRIDPPADPQVWGETDLGTRLRIRWDESFSGGQLTDPVVMDRTGTVVARDGDVLVIPLRGWPSLVGHVVCPATTELFILDEAPA